MAGVPSGTVTFLFTDIEGSTALWEQRPDEMRAALMDHDTLLRLVIEAHGGYVFSTGGDGFGVAFQRAADAVAAAGEAQARLADHPLIRVRMGIHTGEVHERDGDYFGPAVNRCARLMALGHGGQVLCSSATAELLHGSPLIDLGDHRLRDLSGPRRVYQLGAGSFARLRSLDGLPGNLPSLTSSFIGRAGELAGVQDALGRSRLVTVTGVGGVGKTRLALQLAAEVVEQFSDGAWFCELAAASTNDELAQVVAIALGVAQRQLMTLADSIVDFLRARHTLVVLDNCEHLLDAAAGLAEAILTGAPGVRILATSREGLGVVGERVWPLRSLRVTGELGEANGNDAVALFEARAQAVDLGFVLDDATMPAVMEVCRRLDGIPLAIELAAARAGAMTPTEIAGHLDERFRLLTGSRRRGVDRHQTLASAIEWSHSLLSDTERLVFDRLGVFPASFDEAAAVAVCAGDGVERWDAIDGLAGLVAQSMIGAEHTGSTTRYQLLETLRHFARDQLATAGDLDRRRRSHAAYFADLATHLGARLLGPDELAWRPILLDELDNLRAATSWAFESGDKADTSLGIRILESFLTYTQTNPWYGIQTWAESALPLVETLSVENRAVILAAAAQDAFWRGDFGGVLSLNSQVLEELTEFAPALLSATVFISFSMVAAGDPARAMEVIAQTRHLLDEAGASDWCSSHLHSVTGWLAHLMFDDVTARAEAADAVIAARRCRSPSVLAQALATFARMRPDNEATEAVRDADESIHLMQQGAGDSFYSVNLGTIGLLRIVGDDLPGAAGACLDAVDFAARRGDRATMPANISLAVMILARIQDGEEHAATLVGAVEGPELKNRVFVGQRHLDRYRGAQIALRNTLGESAYDDARRNGSAMSYAAITDYALTQLSRFINAAQPRQ